MPAVKMQNPDAHPRLSIVFTGCGTIYTIQAMTETSTHQLWWFSERVVVQGAPIMVRNIPPEPAGKPQARERR